MRPLAALVGSSALLLASSAFAEEHKKGMPQLDFHNPLTISQVVWLAIIFFALYLLLSKWALPQVAGVLEMRAGKIAADLDAARAAKAGADKADPLVRYVVDDEFGGLAHKEPSFADRVLFWKKNAPAPTTGAQTASAAGADTEAPLDPKIEADRLKNLTGDKQVVIQRDAPSSAGFKLPGL